MHRNGAMDVVVVVHKQMSVRGVLTRVTVNTVASQAAMFRLASCCCSCCSWQETIKIMRLMPAFSCSLVLLYACCSIVLISSCSVLFDLSKMSRFGTKSCPIVGGTDGTDQVRQSL